MGRDIYPGHGLIGERQRTVCTFLGGDLGVKDCIGSAWVLQPSCGWPTHGVSIDAKRRINMRIILFVAQAGGDLSRRSIEITVANHVWGEGLEYFQRIFSSTLPDLSDRFKLGHEGNAYSFDEHLAVPEQLDRLAHVVSVLARRLMGPIPGPNILPGRQGSDK